MRLDSELKRDVEDELRWGTDITSDEIAVAARNGVVTLTGFVKTYGEKMEAETAAKRVLGVVAVANDIEVRLPEIDQRPDPDIARDVVAAIKSQTPLVADRIKAVIKNGWVTLEGQVDWFYQRERVSNAVHRVNGVKGVTNSIELKPQVAPTDIKRKIEQAFRRSAEVDAQRITVEANGGDIVLKGSVRSWAERREAERAAWAAPGVRHVEDRLVVSV